MINQVSQYFYFTISSHSDNEMIKSVGNFFDGNILSSLSMACKTNNTICTITWNQNIDCWARKPLIFIGLPMLFIGWYLLGDRSNVTSKDFATECSFITYGQTTNYLEFSMMSGWLMFVLKIRLRVSSCLSIR